jgi:hypothetical protein
VAAPLGWRCAGRLVVADDRVLAGLTAAVAEWGGGAAADRLCSSCVDLLTVDGAGLSITSGGAFYSVGVAGTGIQAVDDLQSTLREGPCLDAVSSSAPMLAADLNNTRRWPAFAAAAVRSGVRALFAVPVTVSGFPVGMLTLCRHLPGRLTDASTTGLFFAAELATLPLLDVMGTDMRAAVDDIGSPAWAELGSMMQSEVYQATGVLTAQLRVRPAEAIVRLRAHAFAVGLTISDVAHQILEHRLYLDADGHRDQPGSE